MDDERTESIWIIIDVILVVLIVFIVGMQVTL